MIALEAVVHILDLGGTFVFAISGAVAAVPDPSEILALEFKGEFRRSAICWVSPTIDIDWSIFLGVLRKSGVSSLPKKDRQRW